MRENAFQIVLLRLMHVNIERLIAQPAHDCFAASVLHLDIRVHACNYFAVYGELHAVYIGLSEQCSEYLLAY